MAPRTRLRRLRHGGVRPKPRVALIVLLVALVASAGATWLALVAPTSAAGLSQAGRYKPGGYYVGPILNHSNIDPPSIILGADGIPLVLYPRIGYRKNPVTADQYGLWAYGAYLRDHDAAARGIVLHIANWLLMSQRRHRWFYDFDFVLHGLPLAKPWSSAMAQGQAMSLLERAYRLTGKKEYRSAALRALPPLQARVVEGGLSRCFFANCSRRFLEEYPTTPPSYVLNGFMYTLIGLYDLASIAPNSKALSMYAAGRRTLEAALPKYDIHGLASYDLTHLTMAGHEPAIASADYQAIHVYLLRALDSLKPNRRFRYYAARWEANMNAAPR